MPNGFALDVLSDSELDMAGSEDVCLTGDCCMQVYGLYGDNPLFQLDGDLIAVVRHQIGQI